MTEERNEIHELSSAGRRRREQMLPLFQDAVRGRARRRRQRRVVAGSLLLLLVTFGLFQLLEDSDRSVESVDTYLADGSRRHMGASVDGQRLHLLVDESLNEPTHILVPGDKVAERRHVEHKHLGARTVTCCLAMLQQRRNPHT